TGALFRTLEARDHKATGPKVTVAAARRPHNSDPDRNKPGRHVDALEIPFAYPHDLFPDRAPRLPPPHWLLDGFSETQVGAFLNECGLSEGQKTDLIQKSQWMATTNGFWVSPSPALARSLSSFSREKIYTVLARSPENYMQRFPFRFPIGEFDS